jgi:plastocyanin
VTAGDELRPLYRAMVSLGVVGIVILAAGLLAFFSFEPLGQRTGAHATVKGVFHYDPATKQVSGGDTRRFTADDAFAAEVDWTSLPGSLVVDAVWFNTLGTAVGGVSPRPASELSDESVIPVKIPEGFKHNLPGEYDFVVERYSQGRPVEVLARRLVYVRSAV